MKQRIDLLLKEICGSRSRAQLRIQSGDVFVDGIRIEKSSELVDSESKIELRGESLPFVSRGGLKLQHAIEKFQIDLTDKIALDIGASTGGFTDCMLQNGARKVFAIDVGTNQLDPKLRNDPRVESIENQNFRYIEPEIFHGERIDFIAIDVSFISLEKILPRVVEFESEIVALIKPQFEVGKKFLNKKGIVKDPIVRKRSVEHIENFARDLGFKILGTIESPILGGDGNLEFLTHFGRR